MSELQNTLRNLKLKRAMQLYVIESLSEVGEKVFTELGKVVAEIHRLEKEILRATTNNLD